MTENKRFTIDEYSDVNKIDDNLKEEFYIIANAFDTSQLCDLLNELNDENTRIKHTIKEAYETERTSIGQSVLRQLLEQIK